MRLHLHLRRLAFGLTVAVGLGHMSVGSAHAQVGYGTGYGLGAAGTTYYNSFYTVYVAPGSLPTNGGPASRARGGIRPFASAYALPGYGYGYSYSYGRPVTGVYGVVPTARTYLGFP